MHRELFETIQQAIDGGKPSRIARASPRGSAKSTIVSFATVLWSALYHKKHYILLISDTSSQADAFLMSVKTELEENRLLRYDFGDLYGVVWNMSDIVLSNDCRIQALGAGKRVRGRRYRQYRPDLIICDDLENDENIVSFEQRSKLKEWYNKALSKAGDEKTDIITIGTLLHYDSLLSSLLKNPIYDIKKYKAVLSFSQSPLWNDWERIITNLEDRERVKKAEQFFEENRKEMLEGTDVLWEEREDYYNLMVQRIADGPASFSSEKMNEPLSDDDRRFLPEWIQYYEDDELIGKELLIGGAVDPSMGKQGGDYSAIITGGKDNNDIIYILDADIQRRHPDLIVTDVLDKYQKYVYKVFGVETVQFQEYFKDTLKRKAEEKNIQLPIRSIKTHSDKILRIQSLQPDIKNGRIRFKKNQHKLIEQLVNFPSADHDDGPDALEMLVDLLGKRPAIAEYYKKKAYENLQSPEKSYLRNINLQGSIT